MIHAHAEAVKNIKNAAVNNLSSSKQQPLVLLKQTQNKIALKHSFHIRSLEIRTISYYITSFSIIFV